ncbi:hypothetical protein [Modicisalibacter radicis]|uniref:hypothetical protein n=1 Tax=Halomonas sp. EAR18 TaxID=2518972 RepID=UPI00109C3CF7|nr:hypothetical protein [Halomonas sp. EAR18]
MADKTLSKAQAKDVISRAVHPYHCKFHESEGEDFDRFTVEMDDETVEFDMPPATHQDKQALVERLEMVRTHLVGHGGKVADWTP